MKTTAISMLLLAFCLSGMSQDPGTLDTQFGENGIYTFAKAGVQISANFLSLKENTAEGEAEWVILIGGNQYKDFRTEGIFLVRLTSEGDEENWTDKPANGFLNLQNGLYLPDDRILLVGSAQQNDQAKAAAARMTGFGTFDATYGSQGVRILDNQGPSYVYGICQSSTKTEDPYLMMGGAGSKGNYQFERAWWKTDTDGEPDAEFGQNGKLQPATHASSAEVWFTRPVGPMIASTGFFDNMGVFSVFDANGEQMSTRFFPTSNDPDIIGGFFTCNYDETHYYACGYLYNSATNQPSATILTVNRETFRAENTRYGGFNTLFEQLENELGGPLTGITCMFPAFRHPSPLKSDDDQVMLLVGSVMIGERESSFVCSVNEDGSLDTDFGENGIAHFPFNGSNWPVNAVILENGDLIFAANDYDNRQTHIVKIFGYRDKSSADLPELPETRIELYPVPACENLEVSLHFPQPAEVSWKIFNLTGKTIEQGTISLNPDGSGRLKLPLSGYPAGNYLFQAETPNHQQTKKFSVQ